MRKSGSKAEKIVVFSAFSLFTEKRERSNIWKQKQLNI
ncbi:hypothetical protein TGS27_1885 [Geobacillus stearothermophilus]|uniref:Uncharacterized protein n=1 Tax=Geobacillus stearothermophilus TaxID=1422 RepID=A0A150N4M7_GEOSE|nr:hypothetical protein B4114_0197 [Geobacillus stearothermophilus]OAO80603.1 hypothetical protein TGS27_1885 [Geobacillus stearothermophilus]